MGLPAGFRENIASASPCSCAAHPRQSPFNIAAGHQRPTRVYINHLNTALGSEAEVQTLLRFLVSVNLAPESEVLALLERTEEIGRMLRGLVRRLRERVTKSGA